MDGFKKFLLRGNVVDLAIAVVIGAAFGAVVTALVEGVITPLISAIGSGPDFSQLSVALNGTEIYYGKVINALLAFLIIAAVVYFLVVLPLNSLMDRFKPTPTEPAPVKDCTECLSSIPAAARKCAFCGSVQKGAAARA